MDKILFDRARTLDSELTLLRRAREFIKSAGAVEFKGSAGEHEGRNLDFTDVESRVILKTIRDAAIAQLDVWITAKEHLFEGL